MIVRRYCRHGKGAETGSVAKAAGSPSRRRYNPDTPSEGQRPTQPLPGRAIPGAPSAVRRAGAQHVVVALEKHDGIKPLPIGIDEYANRYNLSVPGEMVQWLAMFEDTKVYADMAFWDIADNYSDTAVRNDEPDGQWWLFRWYGQLTGDTVAVTPPHPDTIDTLSGLAALDTGKRQARVIVADPSGGNDTVAVTGISPGVTGAATGYPAAYADVSGSTTTFAVDAAADGYYRLSLAGARGSVRLAVGDGSGGAGSPGPFGTNETVAYLHAGINPVPVTGLGTGGTLNVTPDPAADAADAAVYPAASPRNILSGTAVVRTNQYAYGGKEVGYVGNGAGNTLTFTGVRAPHSGTYRVMVSYADDDRA